MSISQEDFDKYFVECENQELRDTIEAMEKKIDKIIKERDWAECKLFNALKKEDFYV